METREARSPEQFKALIKPIQEKQPSYYYTGERRAQIMMHTRLRNHNADQNQNLFNRNLMPNPRCRCGDTAEMTYHYLLDCPLHTDQRLTMLWGDRSRNNTEL